MIKANDVLKFWFEELGPTQWFKGGEEVDQKITEGFSSTLQAAAKGELFSWRKNAEGRLAEVIILDQFSRNIYRGRAESFAQDTMALVLAQEMIALGLDEKFSLEMRSFIYMPFMHSESLLIHEEAVKLFSLPGLEEKLGFEIQHKVIIERFHRYPHRNKILERASTEEELEFMKSHKGF